MIRILLVDDESLALARLQVAIDRIAGTRVVGTARDGAAALEAIDQGKPDLVLLDIQMPGESGIEVARALAERDERPEVVFITAFDRFAVDAFSVEAADYLLKPVEFDRLEQAIARVRRRIAQRDAEERAGELDRVVVALRSDQRAEAPARSSAAFWVPTRDTMVRVPAETIEWVEAARDYVLLRTPLKSHILRATMNEVEEQLNPERFLRIHRSTIVRRDCVERVERPGRGALRVVLRDGAALNVGPRYVEQVRAKLGL